LQEADAPNAYKMVANKQKLVLLKMMGPSRLGGGGGVEKGREPKTLSTG